MSTTPVQDYLTVSRDFITALQSCVRLAEDNPDIIFDKSILQEAFKHQSSIIQQHFAVLSILYDREFTKPVTEVTEAIEN